MVHHLKTVKEVSNITNKIQYLYVQPKEEDKSKRSNAKSSNTDRHT